MPEGYYARWVLPDPVDPPDTICFQINVPNEVHHLAAFYGAIYTLTYSKNWQRDDDHTAALASRVWTKIFDNLIAGNCTIPARPVQGIEQEDFMALRVDCDCNVWVTCCDGTEKQILTSDQVRDLVNGQPAGGAPQPQPGGCQVYHGLTGASGAWYVPTLVSTGDTIEILNAQGAWNDGLEIAWRCYQGDTFIAGNCTGITATDGSDPLPAEPHMAMLAKIDGVFYNISSGVFTVPGGVSGAQITLQPNDSTITDNQGSIEFDIKVCNNQAATFTHTFDFTVSPQGWSLKPGYAELLGQWTPGKGWEVKDTAAAVVGFYRRVLAVHITFPSTHITSLTATFTNTQGVDADSSERSQYALFNNAYYQWNRTMGAALNGTNLLDVAPLDNPATTEFELGLQTDTASAGTGTFTGDGWISKIVVTGIGSDPF